MQDVVLFFKVILEQASNIALKIIYGNRSVCYSITRNDAPAEDDIPPLRKDVCKYCPGSITFYDLKEKRSHFLSDLHKLHVRASHSYLSPSAQEEPSSFPKGMWIHFKNLTLDSLPDAFSLHSSIFFEQKPCRLSTEKLIQIGTEVFQKELSFAFIYISSERYYFNITNYTEGQFILIFQKENASYTCRKKQGGSQLLRDKKGKVATSAGSILRRENELALVKESISILKDKKDLFSLAFRRYLHISPHLKEYIKLSEIFNDHLYDDVVKSCPYPSGLNSQLNDAIGMLQEITSLHPV